MRHFLLAAIITMVPALVGANIWVNNGIDPDCTDTSSAYSASPSVGANYCYAITADDEDTGVLNPVGCGPQSKLRNANHDDASINYSLVDMDGRLVLATDTVTTAYDYMKVYGQQFKVNVDGQTVVTILAGELTSTGVTATFEDASANHGIVEGDQLLVADADQAEYNGRFVAISPTDSDTVTYTMLTDPATDTATGTIEIVGVWFVSYFCAGH